MMMENGENDGTEEIGLVTRTPGPVRQVPLFLFSLNIAEVRNISEMCEKEVFSPTKSRVVLQCSLSNIALWFLLSGYIMFTV